MANITPQALISDVAGFIIDLFFNGGGHVGIFNQLTFAPMFSDAQPLKARVMPTSKIMEHPVETGAMIADYHVINPKEIELILVIKSEFYLSVYQQIVTAFNLATLLSVHTNAAVFNNMVIQSMAHDEDPDRFNVITMSLRLKEVLFVLPLSITQIQNASINVTGGYDPADPNMENTVDRGLQSADDYNSNDYIFYTGY